MKRVLFLLFLLFATMLPAQDLDDSIRYKLWQYFSMQDTLEMIEVELEELKLRRIIRDLKAVGLPSDNFVEHTAMILEYEESHEQPKWVMHIITPDIIQGTVFRSNIFLEDPKVVTGTAEEADYFLKELRDDSSYIYDDFGFDRGHLASSADFRWSEKALQESYYYSNMSPQRASFNREGWARVESWLRSYVYEDPSTQLIVFTAPVLHPGLPKIERSINQVSIPEEFIKVAIDVKNERGFAILMPNTLIEKPIESYVKSIDEIEAMLQLNLFFGLDDALEEKIEASTDPSFWIPEFIEGNVVPLNPENLPAKHVNSLMAKNHVGSKKKISVCGTVVSSRYSRTGNLWMNLDKTFPNQVFSIMIRKKDLIHFPFDPKTYFYDKTICCYGKVTELNGTPTMTVSGSQDFSEWTGIQKK